MRFSEVFAASAAASLVAAHGGIPGAPKLFGLPGDIKIRTPSPRAARAADAAAAQGPHYLHARQGGDANNRCGPDFGGAKCAAGYCCSGAGYCGTTSDHCMAPDCLFNYGPGCDANKIPAGASTRNDARPVKGSVPYGGAGIYSCEKAGTVAITYDDGPYIYTDEVLNKFKAAGFKATFFITGNNIGKGAIDEKWSAVIKRMEAEGHQVASHTWSHQDLSLITETEVYDQMVKNEMALRNILGKYPTYMRPPYSSCNTVCQNVLQKLGYVISYFDLDTDDYNNLTPTKIENAKNNFRNSVNAANPAADSRLAIGHDIHELTALNLTVTMIETLQARGFKGVTMGECMNEPKANWYRDSTPGTGTPTSTATSGPAPTGAVSTDGSCGPGSNNQICLGSEFGNCCSQYGWCGSTTDHCGAGCNTLFGNCGSNDNTPTTTTTAAPQPTGALKTSTDGTCGASTGFTCVGFVHEGVKSECCSQYGYCGASTGHCGAGCNPLAGTCVSSSVSSLVESVASTSMSSTLQAPSVTSTIVSSLSALPSVSTDKSGDKSSTLSSTQDVTSSATNKPESTISSVSSIGSQLSTVPTTPSVTRSSIGSPVASSTTLASQTKPATSTTPSKPTPTSKPVSKDGKCGGAKDQTCAGYKSSFLKLECCNKTTGRCAADPWGCTVGCDKKYGKCWY